MSGTAVLPFWTEQLFYYWAAEPSYKRAAQPPWHRFTVQQLISTFLLPFGGTNVSPKSGTAVLPFWAAQPFCYWSAQRSHRRAAQSSSKSPDLLSACDFDSSRAGFRLDDGQQLSRQAAADHRDRIRDLGKIVAPRRRQLHRARTIAEGTP